MSALRSFSSSGGTEGDEEDEDDYIVFSFDNNDDDDEDNDEDEDEDDFMTTSTREEYRPTWTGGNSLDDLFSSSSPSTSGSIDSLFGDDCDRFVPPSTPTKSFSSLMSDISPSLLPEFTSEKYTSAIVSLAEYYESGADDFDVADETLLNFMKTAMNRVYYNVDTAFSTHQITSIVRSMSVMNYADPVLFDLLTTTHVSWFLDNASVRDVATLVGSFNRLGYGPGVEFFESVSSRSESLLLNDDPNAIALLSYSLSTSPSHTQTTTTVYSLSAYFNELVKRSSDLVGILGRVEGGKHYQNYTPKTAGILALSVAASSPLQLWSLDLATALGNQKRALVEEGELEDVANVMVFMGEGGYKDEAKGILEVLEDKMEVLEGGDDEEDVGEMGEEGEEEVVDGKESKDDEEEENVEERDVFSFDDDDDDDNDDDNNDTTEKWVDNSPLPTYSSPPSSSAYLRTDDGEPKSQPLAVILNAIVDLGLWEEHRELGDFMWREFKRCDDEENVKVIREKIGAVDDN